jgi:hypothetical protein
MSSNRRIKASRANGAKSRGPVTPEGKQKSSGNSARHNLLSSVIVLRDEKLETFNQLHASLISEFNPQSAAQSALVETMAAARWRLLRIWAIERETLEAAIDKHDPSAHSTAACVAFAFRDLANDSRTLDLLHRYESRFDRQFSRAVNLFLKLASPDSPLTQTCQTDLVPESDTPGSVSAPPPQAGDDQPAPVAFEPLIPHLLPSLHPPPAVPSENPPAPQSQSQEFASPRQVFITPIPKAG